MRLFTLFLLWPLAEIVLFVTVGGAIGLVWTLLIIAGTAMLGGLALAVARGPVGGRDAARAAYRAGGRSWATRR